MPDLTVGAIARLRALRNRRTRERPAPADATQGIPGQPSDPVLPPASEHVPDPAPERVPDPAPERVPINYSGQDLRGRDFSGQDLRGANLSGANLTDANLSGANLTKADFTDADLTNAVRRPGISRADMEGVKGLDTAKGLVD